MIKRVKSHHDFMWSYLRALLKAFSRPSMIFLIFLWFSVVFASSAGIYFCEKPYNEKIQSFLDALYYIVTIMTSVGLGDIAPVTSLGRALSMAVMMIGTGLFACLTAVLAVIILHIEIDRQENN